MNELLPPNAVSLINGKPMASSLRIAEIFRKRHDNVIRDIESLQVPDSFKFLNFEETLSDVSQPNGGTRKIKFYNLTFNAFSLIVMGYTGKKAMEFKVSYIEAFERMVEQLKGAEKSLLELLPDIEEKVFTIFNHDLRVVFLDKQPFFVLYDICQFIGTPTGSYGTIKLLFRPGKMYHEFKTIPQNGITRIVSKKELLKFLNLSTKHEIRILRLWILETFKETKHVCLISETEDLLKLN